MKRTASLAVAGQTGCFEPGCTFNVESRAMPFVFIWQKATAKFKPPALVVVALDAPDTRFRFSIKSEGLRQELRRII